MSRYTTKRSEMLAACSFVLNATWDGSYKDTPLGRIPIVTTTQLFPRFRNNGFGTWKTLDYTTIEIPCLRDAEKQLDWKSSMVNQTGGWEGYVVLIGSAGQAQKIFVTPIMFNYQTNMYDGDRYTFTGA